MALATRCPNCHTTFRVVQDQLKLYSGIVRCGVCQQVFNGADHLVKEESPVENAPSIPEPDAPPQALDSAPVTVGDESEELSEELHDMLEKLRSWNSTATRQPAHDDPEPSPAPSSGVLEENLSLELAPQKLSADDEFAPTELRVDEYADLDTLESHASQEELPVIALDLDEKEIDAKSAYYEIDLSPTTSEILELDGLDLDEPKPESDFTEWRDTVSQNEEDKPREPAKEWQDELPAYNQAALDAYLSEPEETEPEAAEPAAVQTALAIRPSVPTAEPEFVKKAKSRQRSRRFSRVMLSLCSLFLLAVLALQGIYAFHDQIALRMPWAAPVVTEVCSFFDCETRVSSNIDELSLESTELQSLPNRPNTFVLDIVLRNRSSSAQAWPILELTLNDESGQPAVRRVLTPAEYLRDTPNARAIDKGFAGQSEQAVKLVFTLDQAQAAGYRVYLFYP